jgi:signal transduction histidine kinase
MALSSIPANRQRAYWACQLGGWTLYALGQISTLLFHASNVLWGVFIVALNIPLGIGLTHAYRAFIQWRRWTDRSLLHLAPRVAAATVVLSLAFTAGSAGIALATTPWSPFGGVTLADLTLPQLLNTANRVSPTFLLWSVLYFGIHFFWNYRSSEIDRLQLAVQSRDAKLEALKLQLNPHFLFNSLNSVRALVTEDPRQAQRVVTRLARLLRTALKSNRSATVPLGRELELVRTYLKLEAVRLEERLSFQIEAAPETMDRPVPPLVVQTLVENGIKHGVATCPDGGHVHIATWLADNVLRLRVTNTGRLRDDDRNGGLGLENVRERLRLLFGDAARLTLRMDGPNTVQADAWLPDAPVRPSSVEAGPDTRPAFPTLV